MELAVLGPLVARRDGAPLDLGKHKQRALLAALAMHVGRPVPVDTLIDLVWGDNAPAAVTATIQSYVSVLRRVLEPERPPRTPASVLVTSAPGYALLLPDHAVDARRFEDAVVERHRALRPLGGIPPRPPGQSPTREEVSAAEVELGAALQMWRGAPYSELGDATSAAAERMRLEELRLMAEEDRARANLALGRHAEVAARLEALAEENPFHEGLAAVRAVALVRCGRQADALEVLRRTRDALTADLGIEPAEALRAVQVAVLRQEDWLTWRPLPEGASPRPDPGRGAPGRVLGDPAAPQAATVPPTPAFADPVAPWPMLGRATHLAALLAAIDAARSGRPSFSVVTGDPGIGKTRLVREAARRAVDMGIAVAVGRCSQDDGAPPLWPWTTILRTLGTDLGAVASREDAHQFSVWEQIADTVREAARLQPLLLVFDDLHWADSSTLRVLRLLVESAEDERLAVIATWRPRPEPTGALADLAEVLARHHARRLELTGLSSDEVAQVIGEVAGLHPTPEQASALTARTDGNPFFVVEYARLAEQRGDVERLLAGTDLPTAVHDVIARRVDRLPEATRSALRQGAVIGRHFDAHVLAESAQMSPDSLLDVLEPAQAAGLLREDGVDRYSFAHALVRDALYADLSASRRARTHAAVAQALSARRGQETEVARHWLAAGPGHAAEAWRSAVRAAAVARGLHAHDEAADLLSAALEAMGSDTEVTAEDRYGVLMRLVDAYRWAGMWTELTATAAEAAALAETLGDPVRVAEAAISTTTGGLWQSAAYGQVNEPIVRALQASVRTLPPGDSTLRCRVLLGLANELYYGATSDEKQRVVDEAVAMAARLGDERLLLDAYLIAFLGVWRPATAHQRLQYAAEATALTQRLGLEQEFALAATQRAVALGELGQPDEMREWARIARREAERLRLPYVLIVLANLELPWHAMAGRFDRCEELAAQTRRLDLRLGLRQSGDPTTGAAISQAIWRPAPGWPTAPTAIPSGPFSHPAIVAAFLCRLGHADRAREHLRHRPVSLAVDDWTSMLVWCNAAEVALYLGDRELGTMVRSLLEPYRGRSCSAGSSNAAGPVDAYLALAAAATGDRDAAAAHADQALGLCAQWDIPLVADWLREVERRYWR